MSGYPPIEAIEVVLNTRNLETHIVPVNVAAAMSFTMDELKRNFAGRNDLLDLLYRRWVNHVDGGRQKRTIWDLSVITCLIHPEMGTEIQVTTPPENTQRQVFVFSKIDGSGIRREFYDAVAKHYGISFEK